MENGQPVPGSLYVYAPNKIAPVIFAAAYGVSAWAIYGSVSDRYMSWRLIGLHPFCAVLFTGGYALREYGAFHYFYTTPNLLVLIVSQVLIYVCPPLLELSNYHVLGRIFSYVPHFATLPPGKVLSIFGALMMLVETLNALGVSLASNPSGSHNQQQLGSRLSVAALALQLGVIGTFVLMAGVFHRRCVRARLHLRVPAVSTLLVALYASTALILVRCVYRLVEHAGNTAVDLADPASLVALSPVLRYEWYFYVFEATLMLLNSLVWNLWNPGRFLPRNAHVYLAEDGRTELEDEGLSDDRPLLAKAASVVTFGILFRKKKDRRPFHELGEYREGH